jgi:3-deoxy-7-phosphoheptulonate synthase
MISDINVSVKRPIDTPNELDSKLPLTSEEADFVTQSRQVVQNVLDGKDKRKIVIVGPCSIHCIDAALEYAISLVQIIRDNPNIYFLMRVYFEKPRTSVGWKGFIYDPYLDGSNKIYHGLYTARKLLKDITALGVPVATEFLDSIIPQYLADYVAWVAIGARTTESQVHRQLASGLSAPVGFKNGTLGNTDVMVNALKACCSSHCFMGIDLDGHICQIETNGNKYCHSILRGGQNGPNYYIENVAKLTKELEKAGVSNKIMIDASHGNALSCAENQKIVISGSYNTLKRYDNVIGFMVESNINGGKQVLSETLRYGVSITDECLSLDETKKMLEELNEMLGCI